MKAFPFAVLLGRLCLAAECNAGSCADETSLIQVKKTLELGRDRNATQDAIELDSVKENASAAVNAAETFVSETASDEKAAKAAAQTAKYAADKAALALKSAQHQADAASAQVNEASRKLLAANLAAQQANATALAAADAWNATALASQIATAKAQAAQNLTITTQQNVRETEAAEKAALANYNAVKAATKRGEIEAAAVADEAAAKAAADDAATSRVIADAHEAYEEIAAFNASVANSVYKDVAATAKDAIKLSNHAESQAAHAANQAQKFDAKSAAATLDPSVNISGPADDAAVVQTVVVSGGAAAP